MQQSPVNARFICCFSCGRRAPCRTIVPTSQARGVESGGFRPSGQFNNWEIFLMNKKLLAVAVAGALASPVVAFAQSSVTLYGSADVAYVSKVYKTGSGLTFSRTQGIGEGWNAGNRIGFRGSEDLGGGLSAQFLIEN